MKNLLLMTARRTWECAPDSIRLTVLSQPQIRQRIQGVGTFMTMSIQQPPTAIFATNPPGLVAQQGAWPAISDEQIIVLRALYIDAWRITLEFVGPPQVADEFWAKLRQELASVRAGDNLPALGTVVHQMDYSVFVVDLDVSADAVLQPGVRQVLREFANDSASVQDTQGGARWQYASIGSAAVYPGDEIFTGGFLLVPRAGTVVGSHRYLSTAPLNTERHTEYLQALESAMKQ